jgi:DNA-directed RNA polymerase subunit RPC12/RpoP
MSNVSFTASAPIKYRYVCEKCGKQTDWLEARILETLSENKRFIEKEQDVRARLLRRFWDGYPENAKAILEGKYSLAAGLKGKCPDCGSRQSWEMAANQIWIWLFGAIVSPLIGLLLLNLGVSGDISNLGELARVGFGWILVAAGFVALLGLIMDIVNMSKVKASISHTTVRNKPEFEFPEPPEEFRLKKSV